MATENNCLQDREAYTILTPKQHIMDPYNNKFNETVIKMVRESNKHIIIDLSNVEYLFSRDIGNIVRAYKELSEKGRRMAIIRARPEIRTILKAVGLEKHIPCFDFEEEILLWLDELGIEDCCPTQYTIHLDIIKNISIISFGDTSTEIGLLELDDVMQNTLNECTNSFLIVDLHNVITVEEKIFDTFIAWSTEGRKVVLCSVNKLITDYLQFLEFKDQFSTYDSVEDALANVN